MALKLYHAEPLANSLKSLAPLHCRGIPFEGVYVDLHKFEQHEPWFVAINPEGQVPVLDHDGVIITHTTVINEYLEAPFPIIHRYDLQTRRAGRACGTGTSSSTSM